MPPEAMKSVLTRMLRELHLPTIRECFEESARRAEQESLGYERYLLELVEQEVENRRVNRIERFLRESKIPLEKTLDAFDLKRLPTKVQRQVKTLAEGDFLERAENVLAFGNPGSGKTHLLCAIGQELIARGRRVFFSPRLPRNAHRLRHIRSGGWRIGEGGTVAGAACDP